MSKPPAQYAGVTGIEPKPIELTPAASLIVDWSAVAALPPFQMFMAERQPDPSGRNAHAWALKEAQAEAATGGDKALLDAYVQWHAQKGYWPNECPMGKER